MSGGSLAVLFLIESSNYEKTSESVSSRIAARLGTDMSSDNTDPAAWERTKILAGVAPTRGI